MSSQNTEPSTHLPVLEDASPPSPGDPSPPVKPSARRWIVPIAISLLLLGGIGWVVFNRVVLPILMFSQPQPPPPPLDVPLSRATVTTVEDSSDYAANLDSRQSITVLPKVAGRIVAIYVKAGDRVQTGDKLIQIDADEQRAQVASRRAGVNTAAAEVNTAIADVASAQETLRSLQAQQAAAAANVQLNQDDYRRFQDLYQAGATSKQSLEQKRNAIQTAQAELNRAKADVQAQQSAIARAQAQVERNRQAVAQAQANVWEGRVQLQDYTVTAPISGMVGDIPAKLGDLTTSATPLLTLSQNDQLEVQLQIPLERAAALRQGQIVRLLDDNDKPIHSGQISFISPNVDPASQSILAKAVFANVGNTLRTSQYVRARVVWSARAGLLVPTTAISRLGGKDFIFVAQPFQKASCNAAPAAPKGDGPPVKVNPTQIVAAQKLIRLGKIIGNNQEVLEGLSPGDRIVTSGILQLQNCLPIAAEKTVGAG
ncbi:MAG: efflux RND transporter periplasmic adaptor subunit [Thermosynechococcaceae cyanobacterium]